MTPPNTTFRPIPGDGACIVDRLTVRFPWRKSDWMVWDTTFVQGSWQDWPRADAQPAMWLVVEQPEN